MTEPASTDALKRFSRKHIPWLYYVRQPLFLLCSFAFIILYVFLLPSREDTSAFFFYLNLYGFLAFLLGWSVIILGDSDKSELIKMGVAFFLIFMLGALFYRFSGADWGRLVHFFFNFPIMKGSWHVLFRGLRTTLILSVCSFFSCILVGLIIAIIRDFNHKSINLLITIYVDVFRSIPVIVLMVVLFFTFPFFGIYLNSYLTTFTALTLSYGAYTAETFRAGMETVSSGQIEAARSLGLSRWKTLQKITIPQAVPIVIPVLTGNMIAMTKDTAIASIVATPELLKSARELYTAKTSPTPLICAAIIFLAVLLPMVRLVNHMETRVNKSGPHY
jgi:polar amino acid transport system permease protein